MTTTTEITIDTANELQTLLDLADAHYTSEIMAKYVADHGLNLSNIRDKEVSLAIDFANAQVTVLIALAAEKGITTDFSEFEPALKEFFLSQVVKAVEIAEVASQDAADNNDTTEVTAQDTVVDTDETIEVATQDPAADTDQPTEATTQDSVETVAVELVETTEPTSSVDAC